jgi:ribosome-associated toxin RatA of RatAB toxin-antitoxin module
MYKVPIHAEQATLDYTADELFAVIADVKGYPLFVLT